MGGRRRAKTPGCSMGSPDLPPVAEGTRTSRGRLRREERDEDEGSIGCGTDGRTGHLRVNFQRKSPADQTWSTSETINPVATGGKSQMGDERDRKQDICSSRCVTEGSSRTTLAARRSSARTTRVQSTLPVFLKPKRTSSCQRGTECADSTVRVAAGSGTKVGRVQ